MGFGQREPREFVAILLAFVVATTIHEFMHAYTAWRLGDDTAKHLGRITLNPVMHFDPIGFLGMAFIALGFPAIGWGKPVPVNPSRFAGSLRRRQVGLGLVAFAGPLSNVVQASVAMIPIRLAERSGDDLGQLGFYLSAYVWVNILLAAFNMIPIAPLDGSKVLAALLPTFWYPLLASLDRYGFMVLLLLFFVGGSVGGAIVGGMIDPVRDLLFDVIVRNDLF